MTSLPWFLAISRKIESQRAGLARNVLTAGDKKDVVICRALKDRPGRVAIYGWHRTVGQPIQPLYVGHLATWVDYSHGIRLVRKSMQFQGKTRDVADVLGDPSACELLSNEGVVLQPRYSFGEFPRDTQSAKR